MQFIELTEGFGKGTDPGRVGDKDTKGREVAKEDGEDTKRI